MGAQYTWRQPDGSERGPLDSKQLRQLADSGEIGAEDLLQKLPDGKWFRAATAKGLWADGQAPSDEDQTDPLVDAAGRAMGAVSGAAGAAAGKLKGLFAAKKSDQAPAGSKSSFLSAETLKRLTNEEQEPGVVDKVAERVQAILMQGESILYIAVQARPVINISPDCAVLTNQRFILYHPKLLGRVDFEDYYWLDLVDAKLQENIMGATLSLTTADGKTISMDNLPKVQARQLYRHAHEREHAAFEQRRQREIEETRAAAGGGVVIHNAPAAPSAAPAAADDPMAKLKQLKGMLDADLITQTEFDAKKADILSKM